MDAAQPARRVITPRLRPPPRAGKGAEGVLPVARFNSRDISASQGRNAMLPLVFRDKMN
jgi:hypothetical protein